MYIKGTRSVMLALGLLPASLFGALAPEEKAITEWLSGRQPEMIALLERAVKIDSPSENVAGVRAMAICLPSSSSRLDSRRDGFSCRRSRSARGICLRSGQVKRVNASS